MTTPTPPTLILAAANDLTKLAEVRTNYNITIGGCRCCCRR